MNTSERLAQEDRILREIRLALSTYQSIKSPSPHRKGVMYASYAITSGTRLYRHMKELGFHSAEEFKRLEPEKFNSLVVKPNLVAGAYFGEYLLAGGWPQVIVPGEVFIKGWTQEHFMSLWRHVIVRYASCIGFDYKEAGYTTGGVEELLIGIQHNKRLFVKFGSSLNPILPQNGAEIVRNAIDKIDGWGFDPLPLYNLWRQIVLTIESLPKPRRSSVYMTTP